jgi:hypothetical protein
MGMTLEHLLFTAISAVSTHFPSITQVGDTLFLPDEGVTYELTESYDPIIGECFKFQQKDNTDG